MKKREKNRTGIKHLSARIASALIALALILTCVPQMAAQASDNGILYPTRSKWTPFIASDFFKPNPVRNVKVTKKNARSLTVKFKKPKANGKYAVKGSDIYEVRAYKGKKLAKKVLAPGTSTSVTINGLNPNTKYTVKVRAASCMSSVPSYGKAVSVSAKTTKESKAHVHSYKKAYSYKPKYKQLNVYGRGDVIDYEYQAYKASKGKWTIEEWYKRSNAHRIFMNDDVDSCYSRQLYEQYGGELDEDCINTVKICGDEYCMHAYRQEIMDAYERYKKECSTISKKLFQMRTGMDVSYDKHKVQVGVTKTGDGKVCSCGKLK